MKTSLLALIFVIALPIQAQELNQSPTEDSVYTIVDEFPIFHYDTVECQGSPLQCGLMAFSGAIFTEMDYLALVDRKRVKADLVMHFIVETDGSMSDIHCISGCENNVGEEMERILGLIGEEEARWTPARHDGKAVRFQYEMPLKFNFKLKGKVLKALKKMKADQQSND